MQAKKTTAKVGAEKPAGQQPLSMEELKRYYGELSQQYQRAVNHIQELEDALADKGFEQLSFFLSMLFKVMDHPELYTDAFQKWSRDSIESMMVSLSESLRNSAQEKEGEETPKENAAE